MSSVSGRASCDFVDQTDSESTGLDSRWAEGSSLFLSPPRCSVKTEESKQDELLRNWERECIRE